MKKTKNYKKHSLKVVHEKQFNGGSKLLVPKLAQSRGGGGGILK
jgi:hypothetical protein